jgi:hypothetical protein
MIVFIKIILAILLMASIASIIIAFHYMTRLWRCSDARYERVRQKALRGERITHDDAMSVLLRHDD